MNDRPSPPPRPNSPPTPGAPRRRPRWSLWTLLAPAALVVVIVMVAGSLGSSCVLKDCKDDSKASTGNTPAETKAKKKRQDEPQLYEADGSLKKRWKVREGQSAQEIADDFELTLEELKACNSKTVLDIRQIRPGQFLQVDHKYCKGATTGDAGAVVDPEAGTPGEASAADGQATGGPARAVTDGQAAE